MTRASGDSSAGRTVPPRPGSAGGDTGYTDLLGGQRVPKHDPRIEAIGALDEATSALGLAKRAAGEARTRRLVHQMQADLYEIMAELAFPPDHPRAARIGEAHVAWLERTNAAVAAPFLTLRQFVLPGASDGSAALDFARAAVRTAERRLAQLTHAGADAAPANTAGTAGTAHAVNPATLAYVNRLSLVLYYLARSEDAAAGVDPDVASAPRDRPEA